MKQDWKKYVITFLITAAIFTTAFYISTWSDRQRVDEIRTMQDSISLNILSSETQFNLLKSAACDDLFTSELGQELGDMSDRLSYMESNGRGDSPDVVTLKHYYSLLEIKDFLLINSATQCKNRPSTILYFYANKCPDCSRQADVLTYLRQHNIEDLRVYSFDHDLGVPAVNTLANIYKVKPPFPSIVVKGKTYNGFYSIEDIEKLIPEIVATSTQATTTTARSATSTKR